jgi:hypothetical protein
VFVLGPWAQVAAPDFCMDSVSQFLNSLRKLLDHVCIYSVVCQTRPPQCLRPRFPLYFLPISLPCIPSQLLPFRLWEDIRFLEPAPGFLREGILLRVFDRESEE